MMDARFLQIHTLTSYAASLLNRDDAGFAKRIPFGGATRTRISSQCLKRHWRTFDGEHSLGRIDSVDMSVRSRLTFDRFIKLPLESEGVDPKVAVAVTGALMAEVLGKSTKAKKATEDEGISVTTNQVTVLGHPELRFLLEVARKICRETDDPKQAPKAVKNTFDKEAKKNLKALKMPAGLDAAMFGRMVTSDILARGDAAIHVAHAFTVHKEASESDYFSAIDDLIKESGELGSGHINSVELTTGLFYGYVTVDVPLLVSNITGCARVDWQTADSMLAKQVINRLIRLIATVSPGAKLGSTAPHAYSQLVLVEAGKSQPRTLANAFLKPIRSDGDLLADTYTALTEHLLDFDQAYGKTTDRALMAMGPKETLAGIGELQSLDAISIWASERAMEA